MSHALAHTGGAGGGGHDLVVHLRDVAARARRFAERAKPGDSDFAALAEWAGWLHDLGKYREEFQQYLLGRRQGGLETRHAVFGAAQSRLLNIPWAVAFSILGHHAGLPSVSHVKDQIWDSTLDPIKESEALAGRLDADRQGGSGRRLTVGGRPLPMRLKSRRAGFAAPLVVGRRRLDDLRL